MEQEYCDESDHEVPVYYDERVLGYCGEMGHEERGYYGEPHGDADHGPLVSELEFHDLKYLLAMVCQFPHEVLVQDELESEWYYGILMLVHDGPEEHEWYYGISIQAHDGPESE